MFLKRLRNLNCVSFDMALTNKDCNFGQIDFEAVQDEVEKATQSKKKRGVYCVYSPKERFNIAKYAVENGSSRAVHYFKTEYPFLNESTVRTFKAKYERQKKAAEIEKRQPLQKICSEPRGRPTMLGPIDEMVQGYIKVCIFNVNSRRTFCYFIIFEKDFKKVLMVDEFMYHALFSF